MPNTSHPDETPAWIKGDLPAGVSTEDESFQVAAAGEPALQEAAAQPPNRDDGAASPDAAAEPAPAQASTEGNAEGGAEVPATADLQAADGVEPTVELSAQGEAGPAEPIEATPVVETPASASAPAPDSQAPSPVPSQAPIESPGSPQPEPARKTAAPEMPPPAEPILEVLGLEAQLESLLFVADGAVPIGRLAEALEVSNREVEAALTQLAESYQKRGLSLQRFRDKVQLTTSPSAAGRVERFLGLAAASPLSRAALETLAIVAYQQPVTRPQIEAVRGVNSDSVIKNLLSKGLIEESGRAEGPGRPVLYSTTSEFMQHFGLASLSDLPPLLLPTAGSVASPVHILKG